MSDESAAKTNRLNLSLDLRLVSIILLLIIATMLFIWKPWSASGSSSDRTIKVTGEATIKATPDEYSFQPSYDFKDDSKDVALASLSKKSDELVKKLKELGVKESKIKINSDGYNYPDFYDKTSNQNTYTLRMTITVDKKDLSQKVQDYLVSTSPSGQVSPQANFSEAKRKQLESSARDDATKDARKKADQSANNLGFKVGKVKSVEDGSLYGGIMPQSVSGEVMMDKARVESAPSLPVQPGENDLSYTVTVVYYVR